MGKPSPPQPPDPAAVASAQGAANTNAAIGSTVLNSMNQNTPYGSVSYNQTGNYTLPDGTVVPRFTQTQTLSPAQQGILDKSQALQGSALDTGKTAIGNVAKTIAQPFDLKGLPAFQSNVNAGNLKTSFANPNQQMSLNAGNFDRQKIEDALMSRFNQDITKREADEVSQLNARGIQQGSEGYTDAMTRIDRAKNDALMQAILGSGAEQQRAFEMELGKGQFANQAAGQQFAQNQALAGFQNAAQNQEFTQGMTNAQLSNAARQQAISEQALVRSQPINEFATLFGLGSQVQVPQGAQGAGFGVNPADILGATALQYQVAQNNYNTQMQNRMGIANLFGNLGAAALI